MKLIGSQLSKKQTKGETMGCIKARFIRLCSGKIMSPLSGLHEISFTPGILSTCQSLANVI